MALCEGPRHRHVRRRRFLALANLLRGPAPPVSITLFLAPGPEPRLAVRFQHKVRRKRPFQHIEVERLIRSHLVRSYSRALS